MRNLNAGAEGAGLSSTAADRDPILEVAGLAATEILDRCEEIRFHGYTRGDRERNLVTAEVTRGWRLLDFADLSDGDFVREAHRRLLGRSPSTTEAERRLRELGDRSSRLGIVVRLALSPEGRRATRPRVRGVGLPALSAAGRAIDAGAENPMLARIVRASERFARIVLAQGSSEDESASRRSSTR